jgi:hypothetical protein
VSRSPPSRMSCSTVRSPQSTVPTRPTLPESCRECAVHSTLEADQFHTALKLKGNDVWAITAATERMAEGRLTNGSLDL